MKILWICNIVLPLIAEKIKCSEPVGGGWLSGCLNALQKEEDNSITICFPFDRCVTGSVDSVKFYSFIRENIVKYSTRNENEFINIIKKEQPDIIHIFGTEYPHTLAAINAAIRSSLLDRVVISIQGLVSVCEKHYYAFLPHKAIKYISPRDFVKRDSLIQQKKKFHIRGQYEIEALKKVRNVIGRTDWDKACALRINPFVKYYKCNEILRKSFYYSKWKLDKCKKHSIFVSQYGYPIKGFHLAIEALNDVLSEYPDATLYTTGQDPFTNNLKSKISSSGYQKYISELIIRYGIKDKVFFLGTLDEEKMKEQYMNSHVFLCCSSIENSPNSVGEAMILGVPTVSSDVGGVKNLLEHNKDGFVYQADAPYMAAFYIKDIFRNDNIAKEISDNAREHAKNIYDIHKNSIALKHIYLSIYRDKE